MYPRAVAERPSRYRRYTAEDRASAVGVALAEGVTEAERATGIPRETVAYWLDRPEYAAIRERTRDQLAADVRAAFSLALDRLSRTLAEGDVDLRGLAYTVDRLGTRLALLEGGATERLETRTLLEGLDDHERAALSEAIDGWLAERREAPRTPDPETVRVAEDAYRAALEGRVVYVVPEETTGEEDAEAMRAAADAYVEAMGVNVRSRDERDPGSRLRRV